ncbi:MAG: hypothetical protein IPQ01_03620 [Zoogloea sp.]|jgi:predicted DNA binding CopG/RHH family protein|nr:hypothetical protein [Zoogloea sp.]
MTNKTQIEDTEEAWNSGALGRDEAFAELDLELDPLAIDDAADLKMISIRLEKSLIEDFKMIASLSGLGYQPLMRQALKRFAESEKKQLLVEAYNANLERKKAA